MENNATLFFIALHGAGGSLIPMQNLFMINAYGNKGQMIWYVVGDGW